MEINAKLGSLHLIPVFSLDVPTVTAGRLPQVIFSILLGFAMERTPRKMPEGGGDREGGSLSVLIRQAMLNTVSIMTYWSLGSGQQDT